MTKLIIGITFSIGCVSVNAQWNSTDVDEVRVNAPIVYNHSVGTYYQLGRPIHPYGDAISYGVFITYAKGVFNNFYALAGIGYFKQVFGIARPFYFFSPNQPIYYTKYYKYDNVEVHAGVGYRKQLDNDVGLQGEASYIWLHSFRQKYAITKNVAQVNRSPLNIGGLITLGVNAEKRMTRRLSLGIGVLFPIVSDWQNDRMFFEYPFENASDAQQIARNKWSFGVSLSVTHHF